MFKRKPILFTLLAATVVAAIWPGADDASAVVEPSSAARPAQVAVAAASPGESKPAEWLIQARACIDGRDHAEPVFDDVLVRGAATATTTAGRSSATSANCPAMPFVYAGRLQGVGGRWTYYLMRGDQSFAVSRGETFDTSYRLDSVDDSKMVIEYLPLSVKQTLSLMGES